MPETMRRVAPIAERMAMFPSFSIMSIDSVEMMLKEAIMRMNASIRNVIHFSIAIMRKACCCC
jgi:hypothetical protein